MPAYKDEQRGTWYASFYYTDWDGRRRLKKKRGFERKKDALEFEREFKASKDGKISMTLESLYQIYREDMLHRLRASTMDVKDSIFHKHILPSFGKAILTDLTPAKIRKWQIMILDLSLSPSYSHTINALLSTLLNYAVKYYGLPRNPCAIAGSIGSTQNADMKIWPLKDFLSVIRIVDRPEFATAFSTLFWTGIRLGELMALTLSDFNFEKNTVSITKSYRRKRGIDYITPPKTKKSIRTLPIPQKLCDEIAAYANSIYGYEPSVRLFSRSTSAYRVNLKKYARIAGVEQIRVHDLRHSHASLLIDMGMPILLVSERLGHENVATTLKIYGHLYPGRHPEAAEQLNKLMISLA